MSDNHDLLNDNDMCSFSEHEAEDMCFNCGDHTCGSRHMSTKGEFVEILEFTHFSRVFKFNKTSEIGRKKEIFNEIKVSVVMELV